MSRAVAKKTRWSRKGPRWAGMTSTGSAGSLAALPRRPLFRVVEQARLTAAGRVGFERLFEAEVDEPLTQLGAARVGDCVDEDVVERATRLPAGELAQLR